MKNTGSRLLSTGSLLLRSLCTIAADAIETTAVTGVAPATESVNRSNVLNRRLLSQLLMLGATGGKASDVLNKHIREGRPIRKGELMDCHRALRKSKRYQICLEILEWLDEHKFYFSGKDQGLYLEMIYKTKGIGEAEKYFAKLSTTSRNQYTFVALLNCYAMERLVDKAFALFKAMEQLNYASTPRAFTHLMRLCLHVGTPERVPPLLQEMKEKAISPDRYTYNIVLHSYAAMNDLESVERIHKEIKLEEYDWTTFTNLATAYTKLGDANKAESVLRQLEEYLKHKKPSAEPIAYDYLISLYAGTGNSAAVNRVWERFKSDFPSPSNLSYFCMLQSLSKLDDIKGLKTCFEEWESQCKTYHVRLTAVVIDAFLRHDKVEEAEKAFESAIRRSTSPFVKAHECFMAYFLDKGEIEKALRHLENLEEALTAMEGTRWHPAPQRMYKVLQLFEREKDVENAEKLCSLLKHSNCLDSKAYLLLLQVYVAAGKTEPEMRQRLEKDGIDISIEHENLLQKVCAQ